ncbi:MAG: GNAT family N-acetyltransferase, partial [Chloroflexi bacterium]|nr:GNAT family N-acetyltransferase [Chloroflexota bacterium]
PSCRIQTSPSRTEAMRHFRALYDQSFGPAPWYQPYSADEVDATLENPADILFLFKDDASIGFAWLQKEAIEPIGIVPGERGRGYGRFLLLAALHKLKQRGAAQAQIGVWRENETAVSLYQSFGFQHQKTLAYLALAVPFPPGDRSPGYRRTRLPHNAL